MQEYLKELEFNSTEYFIRVVCTFNYPQTIKTLLGSRAHMRQLIEILRRKKREEIKKNSLTYSVFGTEHEFGLHMRGSENEKDHTAFLISMLPCERLLPNGGKVYIDLGHLEGCTPEVADIYDLIRYEKAIERICLEILCNDVQVTMFKNNVDSNENTYGSHENYSTRLPANPKIRSPLLLPSILQKIITGAGSIHNGKYEITQRARFMEHPISQETTHNRGILNTRDESLSADNNLLYRFHHISNDANMIESAIGLKAITSWTAIILEENGLLPKIKYNEKRAIGDLQKISSQTSNWFLEGTEQKTGAIELMRRYHEVARQELYGLGSSFDYFIDLWGDTIKKLEKIDKYPNSLVGRLDWVTKKYILEELMEKDNLTWDSDLVIANQLDYHSTHSDGLFYQLQSLNYVEQQVSDNSIEIAGTTPPLTRAWCRGTIAARYGDTILKNGARINSNWDHISITKKFGKEFGKELTLWERSLPNPRNPYKEYVEEIEKELYKLNLL